MARRTYRGNNVATTLSGSLTAGATSLTVATGGGTTMPDAIAGPFVITINVGGATEEKILVGARTGDTLSSLTRGYDNTSAASHVAGESVRHTLSAVDLDEANGHINDLTRDDHTQYALRKQGLTAARGAASRAGKFFYDITTNLLGYDDGTAWHDFQDKTAADSAYPAIANFPATAWAAYSPVISGIGWALGNGTTQGRWVRFGKTVHFWATFSPGSTTTFGSGQLSIGLPAPVVAGEYTYFTGVEYHAGAYAGILGEADPNLNVAQLRTQGNTSTPVSGTSPLALAAGDVIRINGTYETT